MKIMYINGKWFERVNSNNTGAVPICGKGSEVAPQSGDAILNGLCDPWWRDDLESRGLKLGSWECAMDSRWSAGKIA